MKKAFLWSCLLGTSAIYAVASGPPPTPDPPADVKTTGVIATAAEPGQRLRISGQVFAPDGVTPVPGVFVYAYQTGADGLYQNDPTTRIARCTGGPRRTIAAASSS
jgi:protocatechuate 3,4-dioxygenase beta subunit